MGLSVAPSPYRATLLLLALVRRNPQPRFSTLLASQPLSKAKLPRCLVPAFDGSDRWQNAQAVRATPAVELVGREALESGGMTDLPPIALRRTDPAAAIAYCLQWAEPVWLTRIESNFDARSSRATVDGEL